MKRLIPICVLIILSISDLKSQQIPPLSQYSLNQYLINPAAIATNDKFPLSFTYRKLWAGIDGSPSVQFLSGHLQVANAMGAGMKIFNYQEGTFSRKTGLEATYSYHLPLNKNGTSLSFGLSGLLYQVFLNKSDFNIEDADDEVFMGSEKMMVPDASFGMYLYHDKYYVGIAIPQLFNRNIDFKSDGILQQKQVRHYYLNGGYIFDLNPDLILEPSLLFKFIEAGIFQADINTLLTYKEMVMFGLSLRTSDAFIFRLGYKAKDFTIGYSFDLILNDLRTQTFGSHEIMLIYSLNNFIR
jgi:type IX secretion system PorP/SprF family membrane protein